METRNVLTPLRVAVVAAAVVCAIVWRLVKSDIAAPPNLELTTAATFLAMVLLRRRALIMVPLLITVASDLLLGNSAIALFTWSAWLVIGAMSLVARRLPRGGWRGVAGTAGFGVAASLWFFLWTNLGVWLQGRGSYYPAGLDGLAASYAAGVPFLRPMLIGNLILVPAMLGVVALVERYEARPARAGVLVGVSADHKVDGQPAH